MRRVRKPEPLRRLVGTRAFHDSWARIATSRDDWGVHYVYDHGGWAIWRAALRYAAERRNQEGK